jgi:hypothetical protein
VTGPAEPLRSLYGLLSVPANSTGLAHEGGKGGGGRPSPTTTLTATIETIDNDRAAALLNGVGHP